MIKKDDQKKERVTTLFFFETLTEQKIKYNLHCNSGNGYNEIIRKGAL